MKNVILSEDVAKEFIPLVNAMFFSDDEDEVKKLIYELSGINFYGISINCLPKIELKEETSLPIIIVTQESGLRAWQVSLKSSCSLIATNLETREIFFGRPFWDPETETSLEEIDEVKYQKPEGGQAVSILSDATRVDARKVLGLPWTPGRYRFNVVSFDWISNSVDVALEGTVPEEMVPPASVSRLIEPAKSGDGYLPTYLRVSSSPKLQTGASTAADVTVTPKPNPHTQLLVSGSFSVIADETHLPFVAYNIPEIDGVDKNVAAAVPVTLALFVKNSSIPYRFDWKIPIYSERPIKPGDRVEGYFSLDAFRGTEYYLIAGDYVAYLIIEGQIFGPTSYCIT